MSAVTYHYMDGMSMTEYDELVRYFKNTFEWSGRKYDIRMIRSVLYHREAYGKCKALGELLETRMHARKLGNLGFEVQNFHFRFNFVHMKRLQDKKWLVSIPENKATLLKLLDDFVVKMALADYPDDKSVREAVDRNRRRWASKKMPSMQKRKRGPKPKRRK